jgi:hypothetical protein
MSPNQPLFNPRPGVITCGFGVCSQRVVRSCFADPRGRTFVRPRTTDQMLTLSTPPRRTLRIQRSEKVVGFS